MMAASKIEWTDRSDWNPIRGCTRVSPGCGGPGPHGGCYAEAIAARFSDPGQPFHGYAKRTVKGPRWTGRVDLIDERLTRPMRWRRPAKIFASSTSDIFHESLSSSDIDRLFAVMALCPHHTFQVLTKRSARMRAYLADRARRFFVCDEILALRGRATDNAIDKAIWDLTRREGALQNRWPLANVWLGVSVEDQQRGFDRIPDLLATPAAVRWISAEPLLGPLNLRCLEGSIDNAFDGYAFDALAGAGVSYSDTRATVAFDTPKLDWIVTGGESGPGARPMHPDWARSLRDQCRATGVPFFFKQWGEWRDRGAEQPISARKYRSHIAYVDADTGQNKPHPNRFSDETMVRLGRNRSGRLLDGIEHNAFPEVEAR